MNQPELPADIESRIAEVTESINALLRGSTAFDESIDTCIADVQYLLDSIAVFEQEHGESQDSVEIHWRLKSAIESLRRCREKPPCKKRMKGIASAFTGLSDLEKLRSREKDNDRRSGLIHRVMRRRLSGELQGRRYSRHVALFDNRPLFQDLTAPAVDHLHSLDIEPVLTVSPFVHSDQLDAFNSEFGLTLPDDVRDIYSETEGFTISWNLGDDWGSFYFPTLYELRLCRQRWINGDMPDREWTTHLTDDVAATVLSQMEMWLPFHESGGGDFMCVDCTTGRVIEYDHDWGNLTQRNGTIYAPSVREYIRNCSSICFYSVWDAQFQQVSRGLDCWVDWSSGEVPRKYIVSGLDAP